MNEQRNHLALIFRAHLLRKMDDKRIDLLRLLEPREWELLDHCPTLGKSAMSRRPCWTNYLGQIATHSYQDVVALVNRLNQEAVTVYRRLSPSVLIDMMKMACERSADFHESLDPLAPATLNVSRSRRRFRSFRHRL